MIIRIHAYLVPRSFQVMTKSDRAHFKTFFTNRIDEALALDPVNSALTGLLPIRGRVHIALTWCLNDTLSERPLEDINWGDIDNVAKPIIDCLQGKVIENDRQIVELTLTKRSIRDFNTNSRPNMGYASYAAGRAKKGETDFVFIEVTELAFHL